jgi:hypothetical protein
VAVVKNLVGVATTKKGVDNPKRIVIMECMERVLNSIRQSGRAVS